MSDIDLNDPEVKKVLDQKIEEAVSGLKEKNRELLGKYGKEKIQTLQEQLDALQEKLEAKDNEDAGKKGDFEQLKANLEKQHAKALKAAEEKATQLQDKLYKLAVENRLNEELSKAKVAPEYLDAAKALLKAKHKFEMSDGEGDLPEALVEGKNISEFITSWTQGDQGKHFLAARDDAGGGSQGASKGTGGKAANPWKKESLNLTEQGRILKSDPAKAQQLKAEAGVA